MKIQIKTIINEEDFQVEADEMDTFKTVKERITQVKGYPADDQRLVYAGKVLADNETIGAAKVDPGKFVVLILGKKRRELNPSNLAVALANSTENDPDDVYDGPIPPTPPNSPASDRCSPSARETSGANPQ